MTVTDEQIEAMRAGAAKREADDFHFSWTQPTNYVQAQCDVFALLTALAERDAAIKSLRAELRTAMRDAREDSKAAAVEASWKERQGEDYGSY
jgi:hypothetical protein